MELGLEAGFEPASGGPYRRFTDVPFRAWTHPLIER